MTMPQLDLGLNAMNEYWLQKKTLGGWSHVTWYASKEEALANLAKLNSQSGYSWRVVQAIVIEEKLLDEVTEVKPPEVNDKIKERVWTMKTQSDAIKSGWDDKPKVKSISGWGNVASMQPEAGQYMEQKEHGLSGKVWLIHHARKDKIRVHADEVDGMLKDGWERGGPRTQFR